MESQNGSRMQRFFSPRHVAVIGASAKNIWFANFLNYAAQLGFDGCFYPVNPNADEVFGMPAYRTIEALPEGDIDFAIIMVKTTLVPDALRRLKQRGITHILLLTSGYAEMGEDGAELQNDIERYCRANEILLLGPNCLGFMNPHTHASVFVGGSVEGKPFAGPIGVIAQSGASSEMTVTKLLKRALGISLYVTTGNEAIITAEDCLEYLIHDEHTRVITGFFEGFRNPAKLQHLSREAARRKIPIILLKVGRSAKAVQAAQSHTGAMAGNNAVLDSFFRQQGIIRVDSIEELVETASLFARCPLPAGDGLGICTLSGGLCGMYADLCAKHGIELPTLEPETIAKLKAILPAFAQPDNPLDVTGSGFQSDMDKIIAILSADKNLDIIAPLSMPPGHAEDSFPLAINEAFLPLLAASAKPIVPLTFREMNDYGRAYYNRHGIPYIEQPDIGFKALAHMINYARFLRVK